MKLQKELIYLRKCFVKEEKRFDYMNIERLKPFHFTVSRWRRWNLPEVLGIPKWREEYVVRFRKAIKKYCVGYLESENLWVRPKTDCLALMFFCDDTYSWAHVTKREFYVLFGNNHEA